jgi:hypothetical protein
MKTKTYFALLPCVSRKMLNCAVWKVIRQKGRSMTLRGWLTVGLGCWCVIVTPNHDDFCQDWGQQRDAYCNTVWDVAHGPHRDRPINFIGSHVTVAVSTSSTSVTTNPDFRFKPIG